MFHLRLFDDEYEPDAVASAPRLAPQSMFCGSAMRTVERRCTL